jgi:ParB family chromosome partitioning protein
VARPKAGIGRGLSAILAVTPEDALAPAELRRIPIERIRPNPRQPRRRFDEEGLQALAGSLRERGMLQPVLVRPGENGGFELVAGERRWRAARIAGLDAVPALVREGSDAVALELALVENMAREDLNPGEEARACAALVEELGLTREEVAVRVGRSRVAVSNLIRLLDLPDEAVELLEGGSLSEGHGRALLLAEDHAARRDLARRAAANGWSVRATEQHARDSNRAAPGRAATPVHPEASNAHPDQLEAAKQIEEALSTALGTEVRARPRRGGYSVELVFRNAEEAIAMARTIRSPSQATR